MSLYIANNSYYINNESKISISSLLDETELMIAIEEKNYDLLNELLLNKIHDPYVVNKFGTTAVLNACMNGDLESLKILHENGVDINRIIPNTDIPIIKACITGNLKLVDYLIKYGADLNSTDIFGRTPLMNAIIDKNIKVICYLLDKSDVDITILDRFGKIALYYALIGLSNKFNVEILDIIFKILSL
jgi:ankyrin repeat protein